MSRWERVTRTSRCTHPSILIPEKKPQPCGRGLFDFSSEFPASSGGVFAFGTRNHSAWANDCCPYRLQPVLGCCNSDSATTMKAQVPGGESWAGAFVGLLSLPRGLNPGRSLVRALKYSAYSGSYGGREPRS